MFKGRVGVIGLGNMGGAIARNLARRGYDLLVFDLRQDLIDRCVAEGAQAATDASALAAASDVICVLVLNDQQVIDVVTTILPTTKSGTLIAINSTTSPSTVVELAEVAEKQGVTLFDAPVSGGDERAERGALSIMVGGPTEVVERVQPLFDDMADDVFHVGPVGAGEAVKLVNNVIALAGYTVQMEAVALGVAYGLDEDTITTVVTASQGDARTIHQWGSIDRRVYERGLLWPGGMEHALNVFAKDLETAVLAAGKRDILMPVTATAASASRQSLGRRLARLAEHGVPDIPRCEGCGHELAAPFRKAGRHPECVTRNAT